MRLILTGYDGDVKHIHFTEETKADEPDTNFLLSGEKVIWSGEVDLPSEAADELAEHSFTEG